MNLDNLNIFATSLTIGRRGRTRVVFDLAKDLIIWTESTRWTHNFTRSMNATEKNDLLRCLKNIDFTKWQEFYPSQEVVEGNAAYNSLWDVRLEFRDGSVLTAAGKDVYPNNYCELQDNISIICRQLFTVVD